MLIGFAGLAEDLGPLATTTREDGAFVYTPESVAKIKAALSTMDIYQGERKDQPGTYVVIAVPRGTSVETFKERAEVPISGPLDFASCVGSFASAGLTVVIALLTDSDRELASSLLDIPPTTAAVIGVAKEPNQELVDLASKPGAAIYAEQKDSGLGTLLVLGGVFAVSMYFLIRGMK